MYKDDMESARERIGAWMNCEAVDRPAVLLFAPRRDVPPAPPPRSGGLERQWLDIDFRMEFEIHRMERTFYGGEAVPKFWPNLGPGVLAAFLSEELRLAPHTVWFPKTVDRLEEILEYRVEETNRYWRFVRDLTKASVEASNGSWVTACTDIGGLTDVVASFRGAEEFQVDMVSERDLIHRVQDHVLDAWIQVYEELDSIISERQVGTSSWLLPWTPGRHYPLQCDLSAMISPAMFAEYIVPEVERLARRLDFAIYHLDGPDAARHLDALLEIPEIRAIQWVPGAGAPSSVNWLDLLRRIQAKGRALHVHARTPGEVETLARELAPEGLMILHHCSHESVAREILAKLPAWAASSS